MTRIENSAARDQSLRTRFPRLHKLWSFAAVVALATMVTGSSKAQNKSSARTPDRTELLFLGTSEGPSLRANRSQPSTLLIVDGRPYLIDCGIGTMRRLVEAGVASENIKTIFLTHLHADHDLGLAAVMANDFNRLSSAGSAENIHIYGPPQTKELVDAAFHYITFGFTAFAAEPGTWLSGLAHDEFKSPFIAHEIQGAGVAYRDDKIRITAVENTHYVLMPAESRKQMKSYSYRIETPHGAIVFTGDTGPSDAVTRLAKGADVLLTEVHDSSQTGAFVNRMVAKHGWSSEQAAWFPMHARREHLDEKEVGEMAAQAQVKAVVLYEYNPADPAAFVANVKKYFSGAVFASADLQRYCLNKPIESKAEGAVLSPCGKALPQGQGNDQADRAEIGTTLQRFVNAWNQHDAHSFATVFTDDADVTNVQGKPWHGRAEVEAGTARLFATIFKTSRVAAQIRSVRVLSTRRAQVDADWKMSGARLPDGAPRPDRQGLLDFVMAKEADGSWLVEVMHNTDLTGHAAELRREQREAHSPSPN